MYKDIINKIKYIYNTNNFIPLHAPIFNGNEKQYLNECIDSTFVSSVGKFVDKFEKKFATYVGSKYAIATVNGTSALHLSLILADVKKNDEVITQALSFVATTNAITYCNAKAIFLDVDKKTMGLSHKSLKIFLKNNCKLINNQCINLKTNNIIKACVPMHTFGHPCKIDKIVKICKKWNIIVVEDSAESLGSYYKNKHTGTFGKLGIFSFNGNKIITSGGGGVIVTNDKKIATLAKHLSTTAKLNHPYEYKHNMIAYNYRMPNLNAALLLAQLEKLTLYLKSKRTLSKQYKDLFKNNSEISYIKEPKNSKSNYWLQTILFKNKKNRNEFLQYSNNNNVMTRPIWKLLNSLDIYKNNQCDDLKNSKYLEKRIVNLPSGVIKS